MTKHLPCPVTTIFSRRVRPGSEAQYEEWLGGIVRTSAAFPGNQGTTVLRPSTARPEYTAIVQFDSAANLERWMNSDEREEWLAKLDTICLESEDVSSMTGMERWFTLPDRSVTQAPPKHKMAVLIGLGLYPLLLGLTFLLQPLTEPWPPALRILATLAISVPLMVWVVIPRLTHVFFGWLHPTSRST